MAQQILVEKQGRRHYIVGNTYPIKDKLRDAGCKWDSDRRAWYTGKADRAQYIVDNLGSAVASQPAPAKRDDSDAPGRDAKVAGKGKYNGRTYYIAGRVDRGRTHWDDSVEAVTSRDGSRMLLLFRDGSRKFWAARDAVQVIKTYQRPQTVGRLQDLAEEYRQAGGAEAANEARALRRGRCRGCGGALRDVPHHAAMGGYCGSCAFDEFDC
jgi:hypothetical protein